MVEAEAEAHRRRILLEQVERAEVVLVARKAYQMVHLLRQIQAGVEAEAVRAEMEVQDLQLLLM
jgi:hypothetical protein